MKKIKTLFQDAKNFAFQSDDEKSIVDFLEKYSSEFRSVGYEATAMAFAEKDFIDNNNLNRWKNFTNGPAKNHLLNAHVGLGWALSKENKSSDLFLQSIQPDMIEKVLDGMGYYDGVFKNRATVKNKKVNDLISELQLEHYDQGLGRSIWYSCGAEIQKIKETISSFPEERQKNLWRGIGIACAYVGGCDEEMLHEIYSEAGKYKEQLSIGAVEASKNRERAGTITTDIELVCNIWCHLSIKKTDS